MDRIGRAVASLGAFAAFAAFSGAQGETTARTPKQIAGLCKSDETPLFQCVLGSKQVAVCAGAQSVRYRYGRPDSIELEYPSKPNSGFGALKWARAGWSGGGGQQIHFEKDGYQYVLYSSIVRTGFGADGLHYPEDRRGLFVTRGDRLVYDQHCSSTALSIEGGNDGEINTRRALPEGEYVWGPDRVYEHWEQSRPGR